MLESYLSCSEITCHHYLSLVLLLFILTLLIKIIVRKLKENWEKLANTFFCSPEIFREYLDRTNHLEKFFEQKKMLKIFNAKFFFLHF